MVTAVLIGAGQRGMDVYGDYALRNPRDLAFVAVAEPNPDRRKKMQALHGIPDHMAFENWEDLLSRDKLADCCLVCTMDRYHVEPTKAALSKGYHVLCEKPMSSDPKACIEMGAYAEKYGKTLTVTHVLRYAPFFTKLKSLLDQKVIGELVNIQHMEGVGYWHQAHSYVRGNWADTTKATPMILQKSCHDMDLLRWLIDKPCQKVSSFGSLTHFKAENAPEGSALRCQDCQVRQDCPFDCRKIYLESRGKSYSDTIRKVVALENTDEAVAKALETGPYGRCVYHCGNNAVDHQVVAMEFDGGVTATFTMCAFTHECNRTMNLMGTRGQILCDLERNTMEVWDFASGRREAITVDTNASGHNGSDDAFVEGFIRTVETDGAYSLTSAAVSVESHLMALAAEESRLTGKTVALSEFYR